MKKPVPVHVIQRLKSLEDNVANFQMLKLFLHHEFEYIFFHELEDKKELVIIFDEFIKCDDVGVV